mmetsp:Transcript_4678/g.7229  ORF Transcript_4678/g.7229 Transcript_4678/m.7229 type:complete len:191 (+) Transcript_4678:165-737(+)|eukprot:CAMPEP_0201713624 /NCGR_PEP_ID=MMETSP0593-20130828/398_1 /ASSEMBLY_ACC=CAM_ASM_000672 /TAXON_ID=267983 /ORGANISM="Skeletonema japonicum, Strain CCMP2506" /LENGTH=190 /DNA_ID=CAMNT_0048202797 /DNA_START=110 /DNA_END=682 /DNA_ORIENTATION=-
MTDSTQIIHEFTAADGAIPPPPPLSIDNGSADGLNNNDEDADAAPANKSPLQWIKKNILVIAAVASVVGAVAVSVAAFRPGGPLASSNIQASYGMVIDSPTYYPTYMPTYVPTYVPTYSPTGEPTFKPTPVPTPGPTPRPTPAPVAVVDDQTPFPTTAEPTYAPTFGATITVSTEVTGPPTTAGREDPIM